MVATKNNMKRKNNHNNGPNKIRRPLLAPNMFRNHAAGALQFQQNPIPNPGYVDFSNFSEPPIQAPQPQNPPNRRKGTNRKNFPNKQSPKQNIKRNSIQAPRFAGPRRPGPPMFPPHEAPAPFPRPFGPAFRRPPLPLAPPPLGMRPRPFGMPPMAPPFIPPMGPMIPPVPLRRRTGAISKPGNLKGVNKNNINSKKAKVAQNRKKGNKSQVPQYTLDKPWVTDAVKELHAKKTDLENRLKGNRNDELFAEFKRTLDEFKKLYDEAKLEYIGKTIKSEENNKTELEKPIATETAASS